MSVTGMLVAGARALARYRGLIGSIYLVQLLISAVVGAIAASALVAFADRPLFDRAVAGDLAAAITVLRLHWHLLLALAWVAIGVALLYGVLSWFLKGGLIAVLLADTPPVTAGETVRRFGAGGVSTLLVYARLALWSSIPYAAVAGLLLLAGVLARDGLKTALTFGDLLGAALPPLLPGLLVLALVRAATDYARIELSSRPGTPAWRALIHAFRYVLTHPRTLLHFLPYYATIAGVTGLYLIVTWDRPMTGAIGLLALFLIRQLCALLRYAAHVALIAGQVAYRRRQHAPAHE